MTPQQREHWRANKRWSLGLLLLWLAITLGVPWFVDELNRIDFIGPLGFYMAAQGSLLLYLLIIAVYTRVMKRLDQRHGMSEEAQ